jgi:hypothetical protein
MSSTVISPMTTSRPSATRPIWITWSTARYPEMTTSLRMTVPAPTVSMSAHAGTVGEKMTAPRPIFAPSIRR